MSSPPTTTTAGCCSSSHLTAEPDATAPQQHLHPPLRGAVGRVSALVIAKKETKLGLDLKGGTELIYQGTPTGQVTEVKGSDIDRSIEIIRERIDRLGVSEPEVSRIGTDGISVSLPDVTNAQRAEEQVGQHGAALFLRLGTEPARAREGDRRQPRPEAARLGDQRSEQGMGSGRPQHHQTGKPAADLRRRLPERLRGGETGRRTGTRNRTAKNAPATGPGTTCSQPTKSTS